MRILRVFLTLAGVGLALSSSCSCSSYSSPTTQRRLQNALDLTSPVPFNAPVYDPCPFSRLIPSGTCIAYALIKDGKLHRGVPLLTGGRSALIPFDTVMITSWSGAEGKANPWHMGQLVATSFLRPSPRFHLQIALRSNELANARAHKEVILPSVGADLNLFLYNGFRIVHASPLPGFPNSMVNEDPKFAHPFDTITTGRTVLAIIRARVFRSSWEMYDSSRPDTRYVKSDEYVVQRIRLGESKYLLVLTDYFIYSISFIKDLDSEIPVVRFVRPVDSSGPIVDVILSSNPPPQLLPSSLKRWLSSISRSSHPSGDKKNKQDRDGTYIFSVPVSPRGLDGEELVKLYGFQAPISDRLLPDGEKNHPLGRAPSASSSELRDYWKPSQLFSDNASIYSQESLEIDASCWENVKAATDTFIYRMKQVNRVLCHPRKNHSSRSRYSSTIEKAKKKVLSALKASKKAFAKIF